MLRGPRCWSLTSPNPAGARAADGLIASRKAFLAARSAVADGRYQEALALYRKVLVTVIPDDPIVHLEYAQLLRDLNVADEADATGAGGGAARPGPRRGAGGCSARSSSPRPRRIRRGCRPRSRSCRRRIAWRRPTSGPPWRSRARCSPPTAPPRRRRSSTSLPELGGPAVDPAPDRRGQGQERAVPGGRGALHGSSRRRTPATARSRRRSSTSTRTRTSWTRRSRCSRSSPPAIPATRPSRERIVLDLARAGRFPEAEQTRPRARREAAREPGGPAAARHGALRAREHRRGREDPAGAARDAIRTIRARAARSPPSSCASGDSTRRARCTRRWPGAPATIPARRTRKTLRDGRARIHRVPREGLRGRAEDPRAGRALSDGKVQRPRGADPARLRPRLRGLRRRAGSARPRSRRRVRTTPSGGPRRPSSGTAPARRREATATLDALGASGELEKMMAAADAYGRLKHYDAAVRIARAATREVPGAHRGAVPPRLEPRARRRPGGGREGLPEAARAAAQRRGDAELPRLHVGGQGRAAREARRRCSRRPWRGSRATRRTSTRSAGPTSGSAQMPETPRRTCARPMRREPTDPTIDEHIGDLEARQGNVEGAIRHWEKALDLKPEEPERVREKLRRKPGPPSRSVDRRGAVRLLPVLGRSRAPGPRAPPRRRRRATSRRRTRRHRRGARRRGSRPCERASSLPGLAPALRREDGLGVGAGGSGNARRHLRRTDVVRRVPDGPVRVARRRVPGRRADRPGPAGLRGRAGALCVRSSRASGPSAGPVGRGLRRRGLPARRSRAGRGAASARRSTSPGARLRSMDLEGDAGRLVVDLRRRRRLRGPRG